MYRAEYEYYPIELIDELDMRVCRRLAARNHSLDAIRYALRHGSKNLVGRKKEQTTEYVNCLAATAHADEKGMQTLVQQTQAAKRQQLKPVPSRTASNDNRQQPQKSRPPQPDTSPASRQAQRKPQEQAKIDPTTATVRIPDGVKAEAVGELDANAVAWVIQAARQSENSNKALALAKYAYEKFQKDEGTWNKCRLEYLRELHRMQMAYGKDGVLHPVKEQEIIRKLRMTGFSPSQIYHVLITSSPLVTSLPSREVQNVYFLKVFDQTTRRQVYKYAKDFAERKWQQAKTIKDPAQQQAYLNEKRLHKLGLSLWQLQPELIPRKQSPPQRPTQQDPTPSPRRPSPSPQPNRDLEPER
jgi:hypothetical protein